jgi:hypothetical protein
MDAKTLNLQDALRLASIISKYLDVDKISPQADPIDVIGEIVNKISPEEYLVCVSLMTKMSIEKIKQEISLNVLSVFIEGLKSNKIITLLDFAKSLGK